jgi:hypothetical protein
MSDKKIEFAPAVKVESLRTEVDELLRHIASLLIEPDESVDEWLEYVFVSDESTLADFLPEDTYLVELRERLAMPELTMQDSIYEVALALSGKKSQRTAQ